MIYVVHPITIGKVSISEAFVYGEPLYINSHYVYPDEVGPDDAMPADYVENIRRAAKKFNPSKDYVVIAGDHVQIAALCAEIAVRHGEFRVLRYDRKAGGYHPIRIKVS